ncbi:MAG: hypothetical protein U0840_02060 [Gemmataceae bacterium]
MAQVVRQVAPEWDRRPLAVLLVGRVQFDPWRLVVEVNLPDGQRRQLALAESGQHQRLVDQGTFTPQLVEVGFRLIGQPGGLLAGTSARANRHCIHQRPSARHVEQPRQFVLGQGSTPSPWVALLVGLRQQRDGIGDEPAGPHAPVREADERVPVGIPRPGRHPLSFPARQPALHRGSVQVR